MTDDRAANDPFEPGGYGSDALNDYIHALADLLAPTNPAQYPVGWTDMLFAVAYRTPNNTNLDPVAGVSAWMGLGDHAGDVSSGFVEALPTMPEIDATLTAIGDERAAADAAWNLLTLRYEPMDADHLMVAVQVHAEPVPEALFEDKDAMMALLDGDDLPLL